MSGTLLQAGVPRRRLRDRLPVAIDRRVRTLAWVSLAVQLLIVATGGAVRLTASGLGCPTWPECAPGSFVNTPEMGIHGIIEFGNRTLFFVIQIIAIITFLLVIRLRKQRRDLFVLALIPTFSIILQAVLGGITVLTQLNPYVVGLHFLASVVLVVIAAAFVYRVYYGARGSISLAPRWFAALTHSASIFVGITIVLGIITTGSGPHAGDGGAARNGLDSEILQHFHSWPAYAALISTILLVLFARRLQLQRTVRFASIVLGLEFAQIVVGVAQARLGLPEILVGIHMVLACAVAAAMTAVVLSLRSTEADAAAPTARAFSTASV